MLRAALSAFILVAALAGGAQADDAQLARGELLFNIGGCANCHTAKDGSPLAGGDPIRTPYGTFHAPNITPDRETGLGLWTEEQFIRAMREGVGPTGTPFYPAFPFTSYTHMPDEDLRALKAYLDAVPAVRREDRPHELHFPYDLRLALWPWRWAFFRPRPFVADPTKDEIWNRGAYLVNGPGHCQECHTPRTWWGVLDEERAFTGSDLGPDIGRAPNITPHLERGIGSWTRGDFEALLQLGMLPDGDFVGGDMAKVVRNGTAKLPPEDQQAIITYLQSLPPR